jgi:hypothetical protein
MSDKIVMNVKQNYDEHRTKRQQTETEHTVMALQNDPRPRALQRWCAKDKREILFFYFVFFFFFSFSSSSKAIIRATHCMPISSKTRGSA